MIDLIPNVLMGLFLLFTAWRLRETSRELCDVKIAAIDVIFAERVGKSQDEAIQKLAEVVTPGYAELRKHQVEREQTP